MFFLLHSFVMRRRNIVVEKNETSLWKSEGGRKDRRVTRECRLKRRKQERKKSWAQIYFRHHLLTFRLASNAKFCSKCCVHFFFHFWKIIVASASAHDDKREREKDRMSDEELRRRKWNRRWSRRLQETFSEGCISRRWKIYMKLIFVHDAILIVIPSARKVEWAKNEKTAGCIFLGEESCRTAKKK